MTFKYGKDHLTTGKALQILSGQLKGTIAQATRRAIQRNHDEVLAIAQGDRTVYGINTGFGPLCDTKISKEDTSQLQRNLLLSHSVGVGAPIDQELSKLMMILRVHALSKG